MAVLINFSKMFAGIMIDFAQVVMLSFANPLAEADGQAIILAAMNLPAAYNVQNIAANMKEYNIFDVLVAMLFALIVSVVALVVIVVIMIMLVYRIVMLWFLVILSPAAFFLSTFPKGQQYSGQWWSMMAKYLVVGPVMVFFLYLSLFTMANMVDKRDSIAAMSDETQVTGLEAVSGQPEVSVNGERKNLSFSDLGSEQGVFNFAIIIGLLVGSLVMGQQAGVAGSQWAGKGIGALQKMGKGGLNKMGDLSGVNAITGGAKKYWKNRQAIIQTRREEKSDRMAERIGTGIGTVKQVITAPIRVPSKWITGQKNIDRLAKENAEQQQKWESNQENLNNIANHKEFTDANGYQYRYNAATSRWRVSDKDGTAVGGSRSDKELEKIITSDATDKIFGTRNGDFFENDIYRYEKTATGWGRVDKSSGVIDIINQEQIAEDLGGISSDDRSALQKELKIANRWKKLAVGIGSGLAAIAGGGVAMAAGPAGWLSYLAAIGTMGAAGGAGAYKLGQAISGAGDIDYKAVSKYRQQKVADERNKMKDMDDGEILATMDDDSKDKFIKAAASMEALSRNLLSLEKARKVRDDMQKKFEREKGVLSQMKALMEKNYRGGTKLFEDAMIDPNDASKYKNAQEKLAAQQRKTAAQREIQEGFQSGAYKIKDMDTGSLRASAAAAAAGLSGSSFTKQYKDASDSQKSIIKEALKRDDALPSKKKLALLEGVAGAWDLKNPSQLNQAGEFTEQLSREDLIDLLNKNPNGLLEAVTGGGTSGAPSRGTYRLSASVKRSLENDSSPAAQHIRTHFGLPPVGSTIP